jgi:hypothetical protein
MTARSCPRDLTLNSYDQPDRSGRRLITPRVAFCPEQLRDRADNRAGLLVGVLTREQYALDDPYSGVEWALSANSLNASPLSCELRREPDFSKSRAGPAGGSGARRRCVTSR